MYDLGIKLIFRWIYLDFSVAGKCRILMQNPDCRTVAFSLHRAVAPTANANGILGVFCDDVEISVKKCRWCSSRMHLLGHRRAPRPHILLYVLMLIHIAHAYAQSW
jgi:hypothetical protein